MSQIEQCSFKIENLYRILRGDIIPPDSAYVIKEILDTQKCQEWHDLRTIREATAEQLLRAHPKASLEEASKDEKTCAYIATDYSTWYLHEVRRQLRLRRRVHYYFKDHRGEICIVTSIALGGVFGFVARSPLFGVFVVGVTAAFSTLLSK